MPRWVWIKGECVEVTEQPPPEAKVHVVSDIQPYKSMIDGSMITSRSRHREHLKAHGCIEVGNETMKNEPPKPISREKRRESLYRMLGDMSDRQADKIMKDVRRQYGR